MLPQKTRFRKLACSQDLPAAAADEPRKRATYRGATCTTTRSPRVPRLPRVPIISQGPSAPSQSFPQPDAG